MYKHISIEYILLKRFKVVIMRIVKQTHICFDFSNNKNNEPSNNFLAKNGVILRSLSYPGVKLIKDTVYLDCRGNEKEFDNNLIIIPIHEWKNIFDAINEYNNTFDIEKKKNINEEDIIKIEYIN